MNMSQPSLRMISQSLTVELYLIKWFNVAFRTMLILIQLLYIKVLRSFLR